MSASPGHVRHIPVEPERYVMISLYAAISGYTEKAIRMKIQEGVWIEGREYIRAPDGHVLIDRQGVKRWAERGQA